jgi:hypothetical protein
MSPEAGGVHAIGGSQAKEDLAERIRSILATRNLTLFQVSKQSEGLFGDRSTHFIPHNLYYDLQNPTFTPSIYQIFALSRISGYRCSDWFLVFGFDAEEIPRLQILLPLSRTTLLDTSLTNSNACVPWFRDRLPSRAASAIAPLTQLLEYSSPRRVGLLSAPAGNRCRYIKVGQQDALAFPELLPGSIVRVSPEIDESLLPRNTGETSRRIFLVEHGNCFYCCQIRLTARGRFSPVVTYNPYADIEWELESLSALRGTADLEIRSLVNIQPPPMAPVVADSWTPKPLVSGPRVSRLLRAARERLRLPLREASTLSRRIAHLLNDPTYYVSASSLSDYEVRDSLPRHLPKVFTLCVIYGLSLVVLMATAGLALEEAGHDPIPDQFMQKLRSLGSQCSVDEANEPDSTGFLGHLLQISGEVPFFLRHSLDSISGLFSPSIQDFFWVGGEQNLLHPYLRNALLVIVNRHKKTPLYSAAKPIWQQPLYLLRKRDGTYLCRCCGVEDGILIVRSCSDYFEFSERLRNQQDADVVGEVVAMARKLA